MHAPSLNPLREPPAPKGDGEAADRACGEDFRLALLATESELALRLLFLETFSVTNVVVSERQGREYNFGLVWVLPHRS
jgi:hypothetical protein